jgi:hypothetical protein
MIPLLLERAGPARPFVDTYPWRIKPHGLTTPQLTNIDLSERAYRPSNRQGLGVNFQFS